ncbi:MAG: LysR family transcriptional regulator [Roseburia sp.]|nr:LysR family transcriptional regulator [Roseburia sp.]
MELLQLRYFYESANNENFSRTAEKYMVPASSVSMSIKKLENELGCELFDRSANKLHLNSNGRILQKALRAALPALDDAVETLSTENQTQRGEVRLLVRSERRMILNYIYEFKKTHPDVVFHTSHDFKTEKFTQYDLVIDEQSERYSNFESIPLVKENIRLAVCADNPLCRRRLLLKDLKDEPFVTMCEGSSLKRITRDVCKKAGFNPNIVIESDDPHYMRRCIEMDFGIAFVPEISWQGELGEKIKFLDIADFDVKRITCVYRNTSKMLSPAAKAFYRALEQNFFESYVKTI